ncbi:hypothetical protein C1I98_33340, partial [Spongiactinospora gelatinilytica]
MRGRTVRDVNPAQPGDDPDRHSLLDELEQPCATCGGTGSRVDPAWEPWRTRLQELADAARRARQKAGLPPDTPVTGLGQVIGIHGEPGQHPPIDIPPAVVEAERAIDDHMDARPLSYQQEICALCRGAGQVLTDTGNQFIDLLERYGFVRTHPP